MCVVMTISIRSSPITNGSGIDIIGVNCTPISARLALGLERGEAADTCHRVGSERLVGGSDNRLGRADRTGLGRSAGTVPR